MEYYKTLGSPAKRRKLSGRYRSYSRISENHQTESELHMQKSSLFQYNNKKNIKNNKRVEFVASTPLQQGNSINMFEDNILSLAKPTQSHLRVIDEKESVQHPSIKTKINAENFLPVISDSQKKGKGNCTTNCRSTKNVLNKIGASLPHNKDKNNSKNKNATYTLPTSVKLLCSSDSDEETSFWTSMRKSFSNAAKLHSDKDEVSTEERTLSRNVKVLSDTVKKTNILTSNKTDVKVTPEISLKEDKLNRKIKPFHKSKIPKLLSKKLTNHKKSSPLQKKLLIHDHNLNIPINSVAEKRAVENLSKTDNLLPNFGFVAGNVQKNTQTEVQSENNVSKVSQQTKINVPSKLTASKVSFMNPLISSNGSKPHMTREIKILLDQNKMFGSDFISDLVLESELTRRSSLRKVRETNESPQIYSPKYMKEKKNLKPKKDKQNKILKPAIARNSKSSLKRKILNNIQTSPTSKPIELRNNNQNNNSTKHITQPIANVTVTGNKPNIFTEKKNRYTKRKANIAVTKSQEVDDSSAEDENIFEKKLVPNEKTSKKNLYTKKSISQTDQHYQSTLSEESEENVNGNNLQNIKKTNFLTKIKNTGTAIPFESNITKSNYTKDAAKNMFKELNDKNGIINMKPRRQSWSPGLKHEILDSDVNTPVVGVRMMVDIPYKGKTIQLECLADYALICSNYKPIPGTEGNVVYGNGLHTAMNDICSGNIEMNPNSSKGIQTPKRHHLIFCVMTGTVIFTIRHVRKIVSTGAHFFVPCGISYNIENIGTEKAVLSFFKITRGCIALDKLA